MLNRINRLHLLQNLIFLSSITLILIVWTTNYFLHRQNIKLQKKQIPLQNQITSTPTPTVDETANWKTYTNTEYQFSFKYPATDKTLLRKTIDNKDELKIDKNITFIILTNTQQRIKNCDGMCPSVDQEEQVIINSVTFNKFTTTPPEDMAWSPGVIPQTLYWEVELDGNSFGHFEVRIENRNNIEEKNKVLKLANQILSTFKFLGRSAIDVYSPGKLTDYQKEILSEVSWPSLSPFSPNDKEREVYLVDCEVLGEKPWYKLTGIPEKVPNTENVIELTLKKLVEKHYGGFPDQDDIVNVQKNFGISYKNNDSGINGIILNKDGTVAVKFFDSVAAYGGGSSRVACMRFAANLTALQFPEVNSVIMCIDRYPNEENKNCFYDFQP